MGIGGKMRVVTMVGTRPEIIKLSRVIAELDRHADHVLVHSGQNYDYELNQIFFDDMGIRKPDYFLNAAGATAAETIGNVIKASDEILEKLKPDAFLLLGDTNSCLSVISAKRRKIPIFHMEAGNRCFDQRVPEEINRKVVDHLSDINLVYTEHARRYLISEGVRPETVIKTGSPMREVLEHYRNKIAASDVLGRLGLRPGAYFVVSAHREENVDKPERLEALVALLAALKDRYGHPVIMSVHPRTQQRLQSHPKNLQAGQDGIHFLKPLGFSDYVQLQENSFCVLSDSGTLTEEASILDFPAVMLREAHERPEGMDEATVLMTGLSLERVLQGVALARAHHGEKREFHLVPDYEADNVSRKVVRLILSYSDYVRRTVWREA